MSETRIVNGRRFAHVTSAGVDELCAHAAAEWGAHVSTGDVLVVRMNNTLRVYRLEEVREAPELPHEPLAEEP